MTDPLAHAERTATGRVVLYAIATGNRYERGDEQARDMLASGQFALAQDAPVRTPEPEHTADTPPEAIVPAVVVAPSGTPGRRPRRAN
jgi:hypothetical protein